MNKFRKPHGGSDNNDNGGSDRPRFDRPRSDRPAYSPSGDSRQRQQGSRMFDAVCANCGKTCQVPFLPNGTRPVYCAECFGAQRQSQSPFSGTNTAKESFGRRDRDFSPSPSPRPSFGARPDDGGAIADLKRQVNAMNAKIDTMLRILETRASASAPASASASLIEPAPRVISAKTNTKKVVIKKKAAKK